MKLTEIAKQPTIYVPICPSGGGKSTFGKKLQQTHPELQVFSDDELRHRFYDPHDYAKAWKMSTQDKEFKSRSRSEFLRVMSLGTDVYLDNTNLTPKRRKWYLDVAKNRGYKTVGVVFNVTPDELIARQKTRSDKTVPADAVMHQWKVMQGPQPGEFDEVINA